MVGGKMQQKPACYVLTPQDVGAPEDLTGARNDIPQEHEIRDVEDQAGGGLVQELRTSLAIITLLGGNLDLLYDRLDDEKRRQMIRDIRRQMQRLNTLIDDVSELRNDSL
jgi:signal transduction histidine kinase